MRRAPPHDLTNGLAAAALALEAGLADADAVADALAAFAGPLPASHRARRRRRRRAVVQRLKATTPHAASVGHQRRSTRVVLIAGGLNKGLDLAPDGGHRAASAGRGRDRPVRRPGRRARSRRPRGRRATSMEQAVEAQARGPRDGDVVLLSPGCALAFDWYPEGGYPARGEDFGQLVAAERKSGTT